MLKPQRVQKYIFKKLGIISVTLSEIKALQKQKKEVLGRMGFPKFK